MARVPLVDPDDPDPVLSRAYGRVLDTWPTSPTSTGPSATRR